MLFTHTRRFVCIVTNEDDEMAAAGRVYQWWEFNGRRDVDEIPF